MSAVRAPGVQDPARTARWVAILFAGTILLQRFAVPGIDGVALLLPVVLAWVGLALLHRVVELDPRRLALFLLAAAATGSAIVLQAAFVPGREVSLASWALVLVTSFPLVCRLTDQRMATFVLTLRYVVRCGTALGVLCLVMIASQVAGLGYRDVVAAVVPDSLLLRGFAITYPFSYDSGIYRANAWIGLEPSFVSFQLGLAVIAAVFLRRSLRTVAVLGAAMVSTASGSGFVLVLVAVVVLLAWPRRQVLQRYVWPVALGTVALAFTPFGLSLLGRVGEIATTGSSASLRAVQPYVTLWRPWTVDLGTPLFGGGPGSSQAVITASGISGLLVPTPAKIFFDYGLLAGTALTVFLVSCFLGTASRALSTSVFVSLWTLQPGLTTTVLVAAAVTLVSLWGPQRGARLEELTVRDTSTPRTDLTVERSSLP